PIEFITKPKRGEPTRLAFVAGDFKIGIVVMPDPINDMSAGCTLSAIRLTPKFELAFISGSGYKPNTDVHYRVVSQKASDATVKSDDSGNIRFSLVPYSGGKKQGSVSVSVIDGSCSPKVTYDWGIF